MPWAVSLARTLLNSTRASLARTVLKLCAPNSKKCGSRVHLTATPLPWQPKRSVVMSRPTYLPPYRSKKVLWFCSKFFQMKFKWNKFIVFWKIRDSDFSNWKKIRFSLKISKFLFKFLMGWWHFFFKFTICRRNFFFTITIFAGGSKSKFQAVLYISLTVFQAGAP